MPYIKQEQRKKLDPIIDQLAKAISDQAEEDGQESAFAGLLNYACTSLALKIIKLRFGQIRYWIIAITTGTFKNIADEFYRRAGVPYEDKQIEKNGDVDLYEEFSEDGK